VVEAAKLACIHDDIVAMPMGYETLLVDGGASLSGGQQQRIALARALAHRPTILLLDEATSDLDSVTERLVHRNLSALGCTRIVIAHRLSTIVDADLILVMEDGRIVQQGTHDELMVLPGAYRQQVTAQLRSPSPGAPLETVDLWHLVTDAPAAPVVDRPGPNAAETPVPTEKGPDAAKSPVAPAAKAPAANGQGPAPAKPADRDRAAAQAAWTWRGHWYHPRPASEVKVPPEPKPEAPTAAAAKAVATVPPAGKAKKSPAPEVKEPPPKAQVPPGPQGKARPAAESKVPPAPEVKAPPAAQPNTPAAGPKVPPIAVSEIPSTPVPKAAPIPPQVYTAQPEVAPGVPPEAAKAGPEVPAAKAALPPTAKVAMTSEAAVASPAAGPAKGSETRPSTALARVSQATRRESDSLRESGRPSESVAGQPEVAERAGALPRKTPTSASAGSASTVATRRPLLGMAMPSTPPPAGPSRLRRLAKRLGRKKAAAEGMPTPAAPVPPAELQVLPVAKEGRPTPEVAKAQSAPPRSERPAPPATTPAAAGPARPQAAEPTAQPAEEARARSPRLPSARPTPATDTEATAATEPAAPPGGRGDQAAKPDTGSETRPDQPARVGKRPAGRQSQPPAEPAREPSLKDRPTPTPPPPSGQRRPPGPPERKPVPASARPPEAPAAAEAANPSRVTPAPAGPAALAPTDAPSPTASIKPAPSTPGAPAAKDITVPAPSGTRAAKDQAAGAAERPSDQDKRSRRAWNLRRFTASRRPETPLPQPAAVGGASVGADPDRLGQSIRSLTAALGGQPIEFYERDLPQIAADEIAKRVRADVIVLLLDNGQGIMEVSGDVGLTRDERQLSVEYSRDLMRELFRAGVGLIEDTDRVRGALAGIPGSRAQSLILVPLVHERLGFGVLMAGRDRSTTGKPAEVFTDRDVQALMGFARANAESLRTAVLLRRLKGQLSALENG
jgi:ABC transporter